MQFAHAVMLLLTKIANSSAHPHKGLETPDVRVRLLDADAAQPAQEVAAGHDTHLPCG